jgi:hypothetical protein
MRSSEKRTNRKHFADGKLRGGSDKMSFRPQGASRRLIASGVSIALILSSAFLAQPLIAQSQTDPNPALNNPDKFAWDLFIQLNTPALAGRRGVPDPTKKPGDAGPRLWQTWKITTPVGSEVFLPKGARPVPWDQPQVLEKNGALKEFMSPPKFTFEKLNLLGIDPHARMLTLMTSGPKFFNGEESRINRPGFELIVREGLYSIDGQERFRATGRALEFSVDTIAVKAAWRQLTPNEIKTGIASRFYTYNDPDGTIWVMTGFHISSKAIPNWFWATFEQVDNQSPEIPDRDRYTKLRYPNATSLPEARMRDVPDDLKNSVWQYYVLRGTQGEFTDSIGSPTILGNTVLESGMQTTASCMGCHGRATIGDRVDNIVANGHKLYPPGTFFYPQGLVRMDGSNRLTVNPFEIFWQQDPQKPNQANAVFLGASANGAPQPDLYINAGTGKSRYTQLDFMWEFSFAEREASMP